MAAAIHAALRLLERLSGSDDGDTRSEYAACRFKVITVSPDAPKNSSAVIVTGSGVAASAPPASTAIDTSMHPASPRSFPLVMFSPSVEVRRPYGFVAIESIAAAMARAIWGT